MRRRKFKVRKAKLPVTTARPDYTDIRATFLALTQATIPFGYEHLLKPLLPELIQQDNVGNFFIKIGESRTLFSSHLDTASYHFQPVRHVIRKRKQDVMVKTDKTSILGGDNKAGVTILLHMISQNIPGVYYFFIGEEIGAYGSRGALKDDYKYFAENFDRAIAFDRRGYDSVITHQMGGLSCDDTFADNLIAEFAKEDLTYKKDRNGIFTDTAIFIGTIPQCTNISAGVFHEHFTNECANITFLEKLAKACCRIQWETIMGAKIEDELTYTVFEQAEVEVVHFTEDTTWIRWYLPDFSENGNIDLPNGNWQLKCRVGDKLTVERIK